MRTNKVHLRPLNRNISARKNTSKGNQQKIELLDLQGISQQALLYAPQISTKSSRPTKAWKMEMLVWGGFLSKFTSESFDSTNISQKCKNLLDFLILLYSLQDI